MSRRSSGRSRLEVEVGDLRPAEELERQHARRRVLPDHARHDDALVAREVPVEHLGVARLVAVVELEPDRAGELVDELRGIHELERLHTLPQEARGLVEEPEVGLDLLGGGGPLHLDRHLLPVGKHGAMHLPDRRRRDRREVELEERTVHPQVELGLDRHRAPARTGSARRRPAGRAARRRCRAERRRAASTAAARTSRTSARARRASRAAAGRDPTRSRRRRRVARGTRSPSRFRRRK